MFRTVAAVPELSALIAQLESADAAARIAACSGLALHYADAAAEHLEAALGDASSAVRSHAANLLAELDAAKLAESLRGLSEELKMHALDVLAFAAASDAAPHVRELIDHESEGVRAAARAALGALGGAEDVPPLIERGEVSALAALLGDEVDTAILHALANETDPTRLATLVAASAERGSDKLVPGLLLAARSTDNDIQNAALRALSRQADESAYNGLALALAENHALARRGDQR
jgi:HEAT repeat protein